ncbi:MAG: hypothetical protein HS116_18680 [Planctomycetes bacterium]|nr:hypothetical protein [Planctomycetota bacterium]
MADPLQKVAPGAPLRIPATAYNAFVDAALDYRSRARSVASEPPFKDTRNGIVYVRNDSGEDLERFAVLGLDDLVITPADNLLEFKNRVVLSGVIPELRHRGRFVILAEPLGIDRTGLAYVLGICPARITIPDDAQAGPARARFADIAEDETAHLTVQSGGAAEILWLDEADPELSEGEDDTRWAVVRLGIAPTVFPIKLEQTGGGNGSASGPATWTYTLRDFYTEAILFEAADPTAEPHQWRRPAVGGMSAATFGLAHYTHDGRLALAWVNETVEQEAC